MTKRPIIAFLHGKLYGTYESLNLASITTGVDRNRIRRLIDNGRETRKGFSFDELERTPLVELDTDRHIKCSRFILYTTEKENDFILEQTKKHKVSNSTYLRLLVIKEMKGKK